MHAMFYGVLCCVTLSLAPLSGAAQEAEAIAPPRATVADGVIEMDAVVVSGAQPGPGLWKVSRGDHSLWILGTVSPLPGGIAWQAGDVRAVLEQADQVLASPGVVVGADIGMFRGLLLLPSALKATKNPDGKTLQEVLPTATYTRWQALKQRYIGRDRGIEEKRPFIAAQELHAKAVKQAGLGGKVLSPVLDEVMKRRKLKYTPTSLEISVEDPRAVLADFRKEQVSEQELACMSEMLDAVERDLPRMVARANAWATGDIQALRSLPLTEREACWSAWADTQALRKRGITDIEARVKARWLDAAVAALEKNTTTFALLPVDRLLREDGVLDELAAKGYTVQAPD